MQIDDPQIGVPCLEDAIDRQPLVVSPDTALIDVVNLMSQTRGNCCLLPNFDSTITSDSMQGTRSSCVLVMEGTELLGIFTERDIVRLTAVAKDFASVKITDVMAHPVITLSESAFRDIFAALFLFRRYRIRHLVIVNQDKQVVGIVSPESIRQVLRPTNLLKMRRVSEVMTTQVIHASPTTSVLSLAQMMATHQVSCIVITKIDSWNDVLHAIKPVGIVTERDIVQFQSLGLNLAQIDAKTVMSTPLFLLSPEDSLWSAHQEMQRRRVQRLVVSWDWGAKLGIVTQTSLLRIFDPLEMYGVIETLQRTVAELEAKKEQHPREETNSTELFVQPYSKQVEKQYIIPDENLDKLLSSVESRIEHLMKNPDLSPELQQMYLSLATTDIQKIRHGLGSLDTNKFCQKSNNSGIQ
ncbi:CBS domain-containing protein [Umezakia ovalisporum]|jgi:CBS domain-containing protein|uniref:CBS domain-containing protein n=2 Tax=Umezakia ovalisporum TaxID=75695 RepID=A0AA43GXP8_9CYAN|nr:CBS domain-containing protein [Umezakia ovalisporum]MBI1241222.1 CBS domain-containing protein [Nostoc sp. RI_552]MDH6057047.1 CBS domain-containing protein [Umezakia ovalisporum FSS-43]MDH6063338.1 CBS domain-containing protein [Umezakia ovalisporum FSS-62]MDH6068730.1 CBS domain-containing protein [Umezakia ovalisporum APH033B]MDH6070222.1 CBS domain-containing protein [Umezakia ovalisporum CobakiLakeA]